MHEYYWENYTEMDQYGYENYDNQQALLHRLMQIKKVSIQEHEACKACWILRFSEE